ncbi:MAG: FAD-binding oxidoreductase [Patescibacteria group bacterium]
MLSDEIKKFLHGDVLEDSETLNKYSHDASLFEVRPEVVVFPKDVEDIKNLVKFAVKNKKKLNNLSLTARSAGTDMTGGPLNDSIILDFTKYFNRIKKIASPSIASAKEGGYAVVEPGVYYRDFEKETLKRGLIFPSYPASRELCAMGGIVSNNAGGEKSLVYGKTEGYVMELKVVLADGEEYVLKSLPKKELNKKLLEKNFEGELYRKVYKLVNGSYKAIKEAKPDVSKNSSGYKIWDVWDKTNFDLAQLIVGSQGTLGIVTEIKLRLVKTKKYSGMAVVFMDNLKNLADIINIVLPFKPTSFESFDDHTLRLALKFFPGFLKLMGAKNLFSLGLSFLPEFLLVLLYGMPKLILLIEFEEDSQEKVDERLKVLNSALKQFKVLTKLAPTEKDSRKYWVIRRESFNLLRNKVKDKKTAPFIDDIIVNPVHLPEFLPRLYEILDRYKLLYTIAGHVGNGNFHIIPLMKLEDESERKKIISAGDEVYKLVLSYKGSISAEHNDGLIRSHYLEEMFGEKIYKLFEQVKKIFDPKDIFNPRKKVGSDLVYVVEHLKKG